MWCLQFLVIFATLLWSVVLSDGTFITTNTTDVVPSNNPWVQVKWNVVSSLSSPSSPCWIGLYCPANASVASIKPDPNFSGMYSDMPWTKTGTMKYLPVESCFSGVHNFFLQDVRTQTCDFVLFSGSDIKNPVPVARSNPIKIAPSLGGMHHRVAFFDKDDDITVTWTSVTGDQQYLWYTFTNPNGHSANGKDNEEEEEEEQEEEEVEVFTVSAAYPPKQPYQRSDLCGPPANASGFFAPGFTHTALLTNLPTPRVRQRVWYQTGIESSKSPWKYFYTRQPSYHNRRKEDNAVGDGSEFAPVTLFTVADIGAESPDTSQSHWSEPVDGQERVANLTYYWMHDYMQAREDEGGRDENVENTHFPDGLLHIGDLAYATGWLAKWELFMGNIEPLSSKIPYMTSMGNHERDFPNSGSAIGGQDSGGECGVPTEHRFIMPVTHKDSHQVLAANSSSSLSSSSIYNDQGNGWYSFNVGSVHVIMLETELLCGKGSPQYNWLVNDLQNVDRSQTPWLILTGHRPMYFTQGPSTHNPSSKNTTRDDGFCNGGEDIEPLLERYKVDLCLWGHVHNVVTTCAVYNNTCTDESSSVWGTYHVVVGNGGQVLSGVPTDPPAWQTYAANFWGWNVMEVFNATDLRIIFRENEGNVLRHVMEINRPYPRN